MLEMVWLKMKSSIVIVPGRSVGDYGNYGKFS